MTKVVSKVMKDSGIEWLGDIPEHWGVVRLKYVFTIKKDIVGELGYDILSVTQTGIKVKNITSNEGQISMDYTKYQIVNLDDFVMNHMDLLTGWIDCSKYVGVTSPDYRVFVLKNSNNSIRYYTLFFQLCYLNKVFYGLGQGVSNLGRWRLQTESFLNFQILVPPLPEQQAIATYLDTKTAQIDGLINQKKKLITELEAYKSSLISEVVTKGLDPSVPMKDSGIEWLGQVPKHWEVVRLKYVASFNDDTLSENTDNSHEIKYVDVSSVSLFKGISNVEEYKFINAPSRARRLVKYGDVVISTVRTYLKAIASISENDINYVFSTAFAVVRSNQDLLDYRYTTYIFQSEYLIEEIIKSSKGISYPAINISDLKEIKIPLPPLPEQQAIATYLDAKTAQINHLITQNQSQIQDLESYKISLISEVVTGKKSI